MKRASILACALFLLGTVAAEAQPPDRRHAKEHFDLGMAHYALQEFEAAIREFKSAYETTHDPSLLFNLAQASRLAKKHEDALHFYRSYLRAKPTASNRADAEAFIDTLEPLVRQAEAEAAKGTIPAPQPSPGIPTVVEPSAPPVSAPPPEVRSAVAVPVRAPGMSRRRATVLLATGGALGGLGLATLGAGIFFGTRAASSSSELTDLARAEGMWSAAAQARYDDGQRDARTATALYVVGGVTLGIGAVLATVGAVRRTKRTFALAPGAGRTSLGLACAF